MPRNLHSVTALALAVLSAGCTLVTGPEDHPFELRIDASAYAVGDLVAAELVNDSEDRLGYGACSIAVEHRTSRGWVTATPEPQACIDILYTVAPRARAEFQVPLTPPLAAGVYRLRQRVMPDAALPIVAIYSRAFSVRER